MFIVYMSFVLNKFLFLYNYLNFYSLNLQGGRIHPIIKNLFGSFKTLIHERKVYLISNFVIGCNYIKYKTSNHKYKLNLTLKISIIDTMHESFLSQHFIFRSFVDILVINELNEKELFEHHTHQKIQQITPQPLKFQVKR